jgi:hypothetical protein
MFFSVNLASLKEVSTWTSTMGICLYWIPLSFCAFGYTVRTSVNLKKDLESRREIESSGKGVYYPTDTIGTLIGRALVSICPVANIWTALFDVAPKVFTNLFKWIGNVFDQPLVPRKEKK